MRNGFKLRLVAAFAAMLTVACCVLGQSAQPSPEPTQPGETIGGFEVTSTVELGVRGVSVDGSDNKYSSDLNYRPGFRLFDSSFFVRDKTGHPLAFDTLLVTSSGWSADPSGATRVNVEKAGVYRFDANLRRVNYFNNLNNHARNFHLADLRDKFGDFDLTIFPESEKLRFRTGYSFDRKSGPGQTSYSYSRDEFPIPSDVQSRANDFRIGVDGQIFGVNLSLTEGYRYFKDDTHYFITGFTDGTPGGANLTSYSRNTPVTGNSHYTQFSLHRLFAKRAELTGRLIYSSTNTHYTFDERATGRDASNNTVVLDQFSINGDAKRPDTRSDVGFTVAATDKLRLSDTFTADAFRISGGDAFAEALARRNAAGVVLPTVFTNTTSYRFSRYRRLTNTVEADYQFSKWLAAHVGYRYSARTVRVATYDRNLAQAPPVALAPDDFDNNTNTVVAGFKAKPVKPWTVYFDLEHGAADNVFTRVANYRVTNFRLRNRIVYKDLTVNLSAVTKDNNNPSRTTTAPIRDFGADVNSRIYSGTADWSANEKLSFSGGYTFMHLTSNVAILVPVAGIQTSGTSQYFVRDHYAFFDVYANPVRRVSLYASYRISKDNGQGNRLPTAAQFLIGGYPLQFQSPEFRLAIKLNKRVDWNVGYQYYDYKERFQTAQDYRAHLPYTSLKIYLGRQDR